MLVRRSVYVPTAAAVPALASTVVAPWPVPAAAAAAGIGPLCGLALSGPLAELSHSLQFPDRRKDTEKDKNQQGEVVQLNIKKSTPLRKLMDAYCSRSGVQASQVASW